MNERIRELAEQAGPVATIGNWGRVEWADNIYPQLGDRMYAAVDLEKFAELIVKECVYEIEMTMVRDGYDTKHYLQSRKHIEHICKHFGVTE